MYHATGNMQSLSLLMRCLYNLYKYCKVQQSSTSGAALPAAAQAPLCLYRTHASLRIDPEISSSISQQKSVLGLRGARTIAVWVIVGARPRGPIALPPCSNGCLVKVLYHLMGLGREGDMVLLAKCMFPLLPCHKRRHCISMGLTKQSTNWRRNRWMC